MPYMKKMNKQSYKPFGEQMKSDNIRQMNNDKYFSYLKNSIQNIYITNPDNRFLKYCKLITWKWDRIKTNILIGRDECWSIGIDVESKFFAAKIPWMSIR